MTLAFSKHTLANGLDVLLHEDRACPIVAVNIWYHVGSKNEQPGRTGFAHLFEHLMELRISPTSPGVEVSRGVDTGRRPVRSRRIDRRDYRLPTNGAHASGSA